MYDMCKNGTIELEDEIVVKYKCECVHLSQMGLTIISVYDLVS